MASHCLQCQRFSLYQTLRVLYGLGLAFSVFPLHLSPSSASFIDLCAVSSALLLQGLWTHCSAAGISMPEGGFQWPYKSKLGFFSGCVYFGRSLIALNENHLHMYHCNLFISSLTPEEQRPSVPCLSLSRQPLTKQVCYEYECLNREPSIWIQRNNLSIYWGKQQWWWHLILNGWAWGEVEFTSQLFWTDKKKQNKKKKDLEFGGVLS